MDAIQAILTRRSVRKYTGEDIKDEDLNIILKAGFASPSAHNEQPWEFIVIKDKTTLQNMASRHPYGKMLPNASCVICVCGDHLKQTSLGFLVSDCSAAMQNMLLATHALNLGGVWCGIYPEEDLVKMTSEYIGLPQHIIPVGFIAIGHKVTDKEPWNRYIENKVHYEKW